MTLRHCIVLTIMTSACAMEIEPIAGREEEVQSAYRVDGYYDVALKVPGALGHAVRATGTVFVPNRVGGVPQLASDGTPIRYTCGVTFISPRHAITAAHCVTAEDIPNPATQLLTVQTYRLRGTVNWTAATALTGTFPGYTHPPITGGYIVQTHSCRLVRRCGLGPSSDPWGPQIDCDRPTGDTALLDCSDSPGCSAGFVDVAEDDDPSAAVEMAWTHEVYDIPNNPSDDRYQHYTEYFSGTAQNFHYFGNGRNQLLPLIATDFDHGDFDLSHRKLGYQHLGDREVTWTDLLGCHGTSGSNTLQLNDSGAYEILGPMSAGAGSWSGQLCIAPSQGGYSIASTAYSLLTFTQAAATGVCAPSEGCGRSGDPENMLWWLACHRLQTDIPYSRCDWDWPCPSCPPWERVRIYDEWLADVTPGARISLPAQGYTAGQSYRFSARVVPPAGGTALVDVRVGTQTILSDARPVFAPGEHAGVITATFTPTSSGSKTLEITLDRASSGLSHVTEIVVWRNGAVNALDRHDMRAGVGLISPGVEGGALVPMRFEGDGRGGFGARLLGGERMLLSRQALAAGATYTLSFIGDRDGALTCGMILGTGAEVSAACDVRTSRASVRLSAPAGAQPVAFFVNAPAGTDVLIDDIVVR